MEFEKAERAAILNVYAYMVLQPKRDEYFGDMVARLAPTSEREEQRKRLLVRAAARDEELRGMRLVDGVVSPEGLTALAFENGAGEITVVFRGTGRAEWLDNGIALSGMPAQNVYYSYDPPTVFGIECDYASPAQVEALNWFNKTAWRQGWDRNTHITLTGQSKGGNKAQFVTMHSKLAEVSYSFDGQGFSPEAAHCFEMLPDYEKNRRKIFSLSADNDYVNVLGKRLMPSENIYFLKSSMGQENPIQYHLPEAILDENGRLNHLTEQGGLSKTIERMNDDVMALPPARRRYITEGIMALFQSYVSGKSGNIIEDIGKYYSSPYF